MSMCFIFIDVGKGVKMFSVFSLKHTNRSSHSFPIQYEGVHSRVCAHMHTMMLALVILLLQLYVVPHAEVLAQKFALL